MKFERAYLENRAFTGQILTVDRMPQQRDAAGTALDTGVETRPNGDVVLRIYAPEAKTVCAGLNGRMMQFTRQESGVFELTVVYDAARTGPQMVNLLVDDAPLVSPFLPVCWNMDRPCNYVEVPDPDLRFCELRNVPHGALRRELVHTEVMDGWERCFVYTPPEYAGSARAYPVLYLLHGTGDNEMAWDQIGKMSAILDNLIAAGEAEPFLVVMCNGMLRRGGVVKRQMDMAFETMLLKDVIPMIERTYRVNPGKWNRAIAGLSMGAYTTNDIVWHHPEQFGWVGQFTASMVREPAWTDYDRPYGTALKKITAADFASMFRLFFRSTTPLEDHFEFFLADDAIYHYYGFDAAPCYHRRVYEAYVSKWNSWRMGFRDFAKLVFRQEKVPCGTGEGEEKQNV